MTEGRNKEELEDITLLGNQNNKYDFDYRPDVLESFDNKHQGRDYFVKFNCPEFTSLCPITGQPDFATIYISYIPNIKMVESKSLKLYLFSLKFGASSHHVVASQLIHIPIMAVQILNMKKWQNIV